MKKLLALALTTIVASFSSALARDWNAVALCQSNPNCATCFAKGTQITLPGGATTAIESIRTGMNVTAMFQSNVRRASYGTVAKTTIDKVSLTTATPLKNHVMYELKDTLGHTLMATDHHPVMTSNRGAVRMRDLRRTDWLTTDRGSARVLKLRAVPYTDQNVYNLVVGESQNPSAQANMAHTVFANGILVGDLYVQMELFEKSNASR